MINSYKHITWKYIKGNKKRTILTLIGIILSVALISSIGFFLKSMQKAKIEDMKNAYGSWHIAYSKVDDALITKIKSNPNVLRSGVYAEGKEIDINDNLKAKEVFVTSQGAELLPYSLKEGRFPEKDTELVLEGWFLDKIKKDGKLGDSIKILNKEYTLVGILKDTYKSQVTKTGEIITNSSNINDNDRILLAELNVNRNLGKNIDELEKLSDKKFVMRNDYLLSMLGEEMPKGLLGILVIITTIVMVATIAVIYNAFQISVVERVKQFGLLRAVGATQKQIRKIILREATFLAIIGIPIGLCFGIIALYGIDLAFKIISTREVVFIEPTITIDVLIISTVIGLLSIYISALLPATFAGRISPLVAISSRNSISKEKLKKRKSLIIEKIFGFEGALASKNIKRNRKRYRTTVFSIIISVTLFITFKAFMDMSLNVYDKMNESRDIHFSIILNGDFSTEPKKINEEIIKNIEDMPETEAVYKVYNQYLFQSVIDKSKELKKIKDIGNVYEDTNYNGENKTLLDASLSVYDENSLKVAKKYLKEGSINVEDLNNKNGVIIIGKNEIFNRKTKKYYYGPIANLKVGDEIPIQSYDDGLGLEEKIEFGKRQVKKVKVLAVLEGDPFDFNGYGNAIKMITTKEVAEKLTSKDIIPSRVDIKIKDTNLENSAKKNIESIISSSEDLQLINIIEENRTSKSSILMIKILLYGFVIVVSLIGSVNIINTLTTNIILRRREFAALKCIGLTQKGLRKIITLEGMLYGIKGSIYGSIIGTFLSYAIYKNMNYVREQSYRLPLDSILITVAGTMIIGYISVQAPLRRMKRENLIEAVREDF